MAPFFFLLVCILIMRRADSGRKYWELRGFFLEVFKEELVDFHELAAWHVGEKFSRMKSVFRIFPLNVNENC